ncbi:MAG: bifunctional UDP-sugar hydrolase/5'-nucleotidase [Candidatus Limnocylindria bacterium]
MGRPGGQGPLFFLALVMAIAAVACQPGQASPGATSPAAEGGPLAADRIQILHTNDIHGHMDINQTVQGGSGSFTQGGLVALGSLVQRQRARAPERTLLLDGGDAWQGTFISNENHGGAITRIMSLLRYDAQAVGNHDFDWGQNELQSRAAEASFPFLAANVLDAGGNIPPYLRPYVVKDLGLAKVAVLGITNPGSASIVKATSVGGLRFLPAADTVRRYLPELRRAADLVVVTTHIGVDEDRQLAQDVPGIDVIVGAHSHTALRAGVTVGKTIIVQTGAYSMNLGHLELVIDPASKRITAAPTRSDELIPVTGGASVDADSSAIAAIVAERRDAAAKYTQRVVGRTASALDAPRAECGLGNLITDALLEYGRQQNWKSDIAFYNMAGVRAPLPAGQITYGQLFQVLPFGNVLVNVDLTGQQVRAVLEAASGSAGRLHIAGGQWAYRFSAPAGQRVSSASIAGAPLDPARVYHVVTIDYLLLGGDDHTEFKAGTNVIYGDIDVDAVAAYMQGHSPVDPKVEGRIVQQ